MGISSSLLKFFPYHQSIQSQTFHPDYTDSETLNKLTFDNFLKYLPIAVSGMAKTVFSVATRKWPWTETPTPYTGKGHSYKITGKKNHNHNYCYD